MDMDDILLQKAAFHDSEESTFANYRRVVLATTRWYTDQEDYEELWNKLPFL